VFFYKFNAILIMKLHVVHTHMALYILFLAFIQQIYLIRDIRPMHAIQQENVKHLILYYMQIHI
jgi:hypothetical protein